MQSISSLQLSKQTEELPNLAVTLSMATSEREEEKAQSATYRIGYDLTPNKVQSFIQTSLFNFAAERGLLLIQIDPHKPLIEQGLFDCIIHKLSGPEWVSKLNHYSAANPTIPIVDPLPEIDRLHNGISKLEVVKGLKISGKSQLGSFTRCLLKFPNRFSQFG